MTKLDQPPVNFLDALRHNARFYSTSIAVMHEGQARTWEEFGRRTNQIANALLSNGLRRGDRVVLLMESSISAFELIWGSIKAGAAVAPLNTMVAPEALPVLINNAEPAFVLIDAAAMDRLGGVLEQLQLDPASRYMVDASSEAWPNIEQLIASAPDTDPDVDIELEDSMSIIYSSGTTGIPKGIEHSHSARLLYPLGYGGALRIDRYTVTLCSTPLYTNGTWITMLPTVFHGGTVVLGGKFSGAKFLETVQARNVTHAFLVPTQLGLILSTPDRDSYEASSLKMILSGGAPLTPEMYHEVNEAFPASGVYETWGLTEGFMTVALPEDRLHAERSVGKPLYGGDVRAIDGNDEELPAGETGELVGWSAGMMKGYFGDPSRTAEMIWPGPRGRTYLRSGDIGSVDARGFVYVSGRMKDMIISGGINVYAADIEEVFMRHPDVREVTAIGIPHDKWGETPLLLAILHEGKTVDPEVLKNWGNEQLGNFQRVHAVEFRDDFPRAAHDKVLKRTLREPYWEGQGRTI